MKKFFKNNKGFTLVELIIVIAVMAVMTVVVAPQYLKYVESSRESTDKNALDELKHVIEISYVEVTAAGKDDAELVIKLTADGNFTYVDSTEALEKEVADVYPAYKAAAGEEAEVEGAYKFKSKVMKVADKTVTFTVNPDTGICTYVDPFPAE